MASKVTFDSVNKLIICKSGITELDAKVDIYSDTKEDWQIDATLNKFRFIFRSIGGDDTAPGEIAPLYSFIKFGWRIRPDEADHTLNITNGAILVEGDTSADPFVDTVGDFTVRIRMYVPVKATIVASGSGVTEQDKTDIISGVWDKDTASHQIAGSFGKTVVDTLGLLGQNVKWTSMTFDANQNMTGARLTSYTDNTLTTPMKEWDITATYNAQSELQTYNLVEV